MTPSACTVTPGCPIRKSQDQSSFDNSPGHIAACHVLHRLITPRHPPYTLSSLITFITGPLRPHGTVRPGQMSAPAGRCSARRRHQAASALDHTRGTNSPRGVLSMNLTASTSLCDCQRAIGFNTASDPIDREAGISTSHAGRSPSFWQTNVLHASFFQAAMKNSHDPAEAPKTWRRPESNRRPSGCKPDALPTELRPQPVVS